MQASIHQMLVVTNSQDQLPSEEETILSTIAALKTVEKEEGFKLDEDMTIFVCEMAVKTRRALDNPEGFVLSMVKSILK
jgi:hypothetical protein